MLIPPQTYEILPAVEQLLLAANVLDFTPYGGIVVAKGDQLDLDSDDPLEQPDPAPNGFWWRIILMRTIRGLAEQMLYLDCVRGYRFRVRIDVSPPNGDESFNPVHFLEGAHKLCYSALHYKEVQLAVADLLYSITRETLVSATHRDPQKGFRYNSAGYLTVLGPIN